jgi:hypothetical protein
VQFGGEPVDLASELSIGLELQRLFREVVVGLGLLEFRLPVLADHDERRQEDRFERHDQRQHRPRPVHNPAAPQSQPVPVRHMPATGHHPQRKPKLPVDDSGDGSAGGGHRPYQGALPDFGGVLPGKKAELEHGVGGALHTLLINRADGEVGQRHDRGHLARQLIGFPQGRPGGAGIALGERLPFLWVATYPAIGKFRVSPWSRSASSTWP